MTRVGGIPDNQGLPVPQAPTATQAADERFRALLLVALQREALTLTSSTGAQDGTDLLQAGSNPLLQTTDWNQLSGLAGTWPASTQRGVRTATVSAAGYAGTAASPAERFQSLKPWFKYAEQQTGVPWQIQAAQWALETGWGQSTPRDLTSGQESNNLFGVKGQGPGGSVRAVTSEIVNGESVQEVAEFRAYGSVGESVLDHARLLTSPHYAPAMAAGKDLKAWTEQLGPQHLGYATDPNYSQKLWQIITENGWNREA
ncbi:MAG: glycoside hydrolase family 73 protein [Mycobacterium leprae]